MKHLLFALLFIAGSAHAQFKTLNAVGSSMVVSPSTTVTTSTETELFRDTITASNLVPGKIYQVEAHFNITTPAVQLGNTTLRVYFGSTVVAVISGGVFVLGQSQTPYIMYLAIVPRGTNQQIFTANAVNPQTALISLGTGNSNLRATWTEDASTDKIFRITVQLGGTVTGNSFATDWIQRSVF